MELCRDVLRIENWNSQFLNPIRVSNLLFYVDVYALLQMEISWNKTIKILEMIQSIDRIDQQIFTFAFIIFTTSLVFF